MLQFSYVWQIFLSSSWIPPPPEKEKNPKKGGTENKCN